MTETVNPLDPLLDLRQWAIDGRERARAAGNLEAAGVYDKVVKRTQEAEKQAVEDGIPMQIELENP